MYAAHVAFQECDVSCIRDVRHGQSCRRIPSCTMVLAVLQHFFCPHGSDSRSRARVTACVCMQQRLHAHVKKVEKSLAAAEQLRDLRQQQRAPELQREHWRKLSAVQRLAQLQMHKTTLAAALQESEGEMAEESDKAASDKRAAMERKKQAGITLRAARASEIEDEGRLHALERRWRVTEEQLDALDAVKPRLG